MLINQVIVISIYTIYFITVRSYFFLFWNVLKLFIFHTNLGERMLKKTKFRIRVLDTGLGRGNEAFMPGLKGD